MMAGNPHITAIDLRGNGFDADGLYALVQVTAARDCTRDTALHGEVAQPEWRCGSRWRGGWEAAEHCRPGTAAG